MTLYLVTQEMIMVAITSDQVSSEELLALAFSDKKLTAVLSCIKFTPALIGRERLDPGIGENLVELCALNDAKLV